MADDERPEPEPQPYEPPAIKDLEKGDGPLETVPGPVGSPGGIG